MEGMTKAVSLLSVSLPIVPAKGARDWMIVRMMERFGGRELLPRPHLRIDHDRLQQVSYPRENGGLVKVI